VKIFLRIFYIIFQNFYIILSYLLYELALFRKSTSFLKIFHIWINYESRKISKIFCKYNFWWNIIKAKKNIFFFNNGMRKSQNISKYEYNHSNISEKYFNFYKNYLKNVHQDWQGWTINFVYSFLSLTRYYLKTDILMRDSHSWEY